MTEAEALALAEAIVIHFYELTSSHNRSKSRLKRIIVDHLKDKTPGTGKDTKGPA